MNNNTPYQPLVSVIILNHNGIKDTIECLDSIKGTTYNNYEVIVVDNASSDNSLDILSKRNDIKLINLDKNYGFAEGNNIGIKHTKGELICFLNNDTVVDKDWLKEMVNTMQNSKIGETYASFFDYKDYFSQDTALTKIKNLRSGSYTILGYRILFNFFPNYTDTSLDASACCCMYRKNIINVPFDKDYFAYLEDTYLAWRIRLKGYDIKRSPHAFIYHKHSSTIKKDNKLAFFLKEKNRIMNLLIFYDRTTLIKLIPLVILDIIKKIFVAYRNIFLEKYEALSLLRAYVWVLFNMGKIIRKRKAVQGIRKINDNAIISLLSYKWTNRKGILAGILNAIFYAYCKMTGLKTYDIERR